MNILSWLEMCCHMEKEKVLEKKMNLSHSHIPQYSKRNCKHNLKHIWLAVLLLSSENAWPRSSTFWAIIDYVSISNDLASSLIYHHWCLGLNVSVIWHEIQSFVGSSWILTSSSLLNVISTIAWVWESLAFGHNDLNWIYSNSIR